MSKLTKSIEDAAVEVQTLELKLQRAQDDLKRAEVRLEQLHDGHRMLLVRLDGSTQIAPLYAGADGRPVRDYRRDNLRHMSIDQYDPRAYLHHWRERFVLMGQVGKLYIYGEV